MSSRKDLSQFRTSGTTQQSDPGKDKGDEKRSAPTQERGSRPPPPWPWLDSPLDDSPLLLPLPASHRSPRSFTLPDSANLQQTSSEQVGSTTTFEEFGGHFLGLYDLHIRRTVDANGRSLVIPNTDISLNIPQGALREECIIDCRAIHDNSKDSETESFTTNSCVFVELLPNYLQLSAPAKLTVPHCLILKKGVKTTAKVFESHSMQDGKPVWKENCSVRIEVGERKCNLWITQFCWIKIDIGEETVEAKRINIFAAKSHKATRHITNMEVGYHVDLPTAGKIIIDNSLQVLQKKEFIFEKEGKKPLQLHFVRMVPTSYWCYSTPDENPQEISFRSIALSRESSCGFPLTAQADKEWVDSFCYFKASQGDEKVHLACFLADPNKEQPSMSKQTSVESKETLVESKAVSNQSSMDPPKSESATDDPHNSGNQSASILNLETEVSEEDLKKLATQLGNTWLSVARALGLEEAEIDNLKSNNKEQQEISFQSLLTWKRAKGSLATKRALVMALRTGKRNDLADTYEETGKWK